MKNVNPMGLFDVEFRLQSLTDQGDVLVKLNREINWEQFRPLLNAAFQKEERGQGGRPPFDFLMMFKILILQRYYNISDGQAEFQILDRLSFMRFLGLTLADKVPDENTIWNFRENLTICGLVEELFDTFLQSLKDANLIGTEGRMVDASFVEAPRQRNTREENETVKNGEIPLEWVKNPHKLSQKDLEAMWTKKNNQTYYGYKNHTNACTKSKLIVKWKATDASVHDSQALKDVLVKEDDKGQPCYADSAYTGPIQEKAIADAEMKNRVHEKGYKNKPLTDSQKASNKEKSSIRVRVEHIFGFMENSMNGMYIHSIGIIRATGIIGLMNLTYNMHRAIQLNAIRKVHTPI